MDDSLQIQKQNLISQLCEEWWDTTDGSNVNHLDKLFKNQDLRRAVRKTQILELLAVTACYTVTNEKGTPSDIVKEGLVMSKEQIQTFYRLFFFVH